MSSDRRRRARVQGGWAGPQSASSISRVRATKQQKPQNTDENTQSPQQGVNLYDRRQPGWLGNNADPVQKEKYTFEEPDEEIKVKPKEKIIEKTGVYTLSEDHNGLSRVRLFTNYIAAKDCEWMYDTLFHELPWRQKHDVKDGQEFLQPRLTAWYGDYGYSYSGLTHQANKMWSPLLTALLDQLESTTGVRYNSMLANLYRDGHDMVAWHADDERVFGKNPTIASLSFGDTRNFEMKRKTHGDEDPDFVEHYKIPLDAGALLIMEGAVQESWLHRIPREYHDKGPRINLTFRVMYTDT